MRGKRVKSRDCALASDLVKLKAPKGASKMLRATGHARVVRSDQIANFCNFGYT